MNDPTEGAPWFGRSTASGEVLIVAGYPGDWRRADASIPGGFPMVNDGQGWRVDHAAHRTPYSPHPEVQKPPVHRTEHSGLHTKFCVLCLSGEHQHIDATQEPTR
ncbi:hypothetical protein DDV98_28890 [Streptomyces sp. IB2014 011-12]|nr:hypothetical protein STIB_72090 [Streptomyces sp. IB2014 011-1]RDV48188.1 hypothetical protein DDV98_28890 [Streptomyces sp. IB2014 011-12]